MNISFAGCGFLGIYHIGVASCFREHAPHIIDKIAGASAGALLGTVLVCEELDLVKITEDVLKTAAKARARSLGPFHPGFNLHQILVDGMERILPMDIHKRASGRLHISLTRMSDRQNVMVSEYETRKDLMDAILCSAFIPFYSGFLPPTYRGTRYVDGGISDNLPIIDKTCKTITVSPLSGEADICPRSDEFSDYLNVTISNTNVQITASNLYRMCRALYPPEPAVLSRMCKQGFEDALLYLKTHTLIPCERHVFKRRSHSVCLGNTRMSSRPSKTLSSNRRRSTTALRHTQSNPIMDSTFPSTSSSPSMRASDGRWHLQEESDGEEEEEEEDAPDCMGMLHEEEEEVDEEGKMWVDWDDNDFFENRPCERCEHHSNKLKLVKSLPPEVIQVLHSACHSLNPSIWNYITKSRLGSVVSFASLPCVLPLETAYCLAIRLTRWLPHLPSDLRWFLSGLTNILHLIASNMGDIDIKKFEAQFSCNFGLQLEPEHMSALAGYPVTPDRASDHAHELQALDIATATPRRHKLNFQFKMDVQAEGLPDCVMDTFDFSEDLNELSIPRRRRVAMNQHHAPSSPPASPVGYYDSFDYTLKVKQEMDDVLTYHYLKVTQQVDPANGHGSVEIVEV
eukprot:XP_003725356.1 PREDICTED: uncharacterized protein LOC582648 isoform X2 [Strongylocentrotus purpuratus]